MRLTRGSATVRLAARLAIGFAAVGIVALIASWGLLAAQG